MSNFLILDIMAGCNSTSHTGPAGERCKNSKKIRSCSMLHLLSEVLLQKIYKLSRNEGAEVI